MCEVPAVSDTDQNRKSNCESHLTDHWTLHEHVMPLLEPIKAQYPNISRADLWAHAANVAIEALGGPSILSRFGRRDDWNLSSSDKPSSDSDLT